LATTPNFSLIQSIALLNFRRPRKSLSPWSGRQASLFTAAAPVFPD
jgi:hypothetical protein